MCARRCVPMVCVRCRACDVRHVRAVVGGTAPYRSHLPVGVRGGRGASKAALPARLPLGVCGQVARDECRVSDLPRGYSEMSAGGALDIRLHAGAQCSRLCARVVHFSAPSFSSGKHIHVYISPVVVVVVVVAARARARCHARTRQTRAEHIIVNTGACNAYIHFRWLASKRTAHIHTAASHGAGAIDHGPERRQMKLCELAVKRVGGAAAARGAREADKHVLHVTRRRHAARERRRPRNAHAPRRRRAPT
jgi:hypothetical protein